MSIQCDAPKVLVVGVRTQLGYRPGAPPCRHVYGIVGIKVDDLPQMVDNQKKNPKTKKIKIYSPVSGFRGTLSPILMSRFMHSTEGQGLSKQSFKEKHLGFPHS